VSAPGRRSATESELQALGFNFDPPEITSVTVFVVDDDPVFSNLVTTYLARLGYPVQSFLDPREALARLPERLPHILIADIDMPEMSGIELAEEAQRLDPDVGVVFVTALGAEGLAEMSVGDRVPDHLSKPLDFDELARVVQRTFIKRAAAGYHRAMVAWMHDEVERNAAAVREVTLGTLGALVNALDARSRHFRGHSQAVAMQAAAVAQTLGLDVEEVEVVRVAGLLHDVGMIAIPDAVVEKPDALTAEEYRLIRTHCAVGVGILEPMKHLGSAITYIGEHHERWDGSGYPRGRRGEEISLGGQIVGISEAWTAILESRAYRTGRSREEGMAILQEQKDVWFSEAVTDALERADVGVM
jgi:putative nucleotidyltransferase with HDIG domain